MKEYVWKPRLIFELPEGASAEEFFNDLFMAVIEFTESKNAFVGGSGAWEEYDEAADEAGKDLWAEEG